MPIAAVEPTTPAPPRATIELSPEYEDEGTEETMSQATATAIRRADAPTLVAVGDQPEAAQMLRALHEHVERQFQAYEDAEGSHVRQHRAVTAIARALAMHVTVEDELVYPALRAQTGRHDGEVERQLQQDHVLDLLLVELGGMIPAERGYDAKVRVVMQVFRQHARDAEELVESELRRRMDPRERLALGQRLRERIAQLEGPAHREGSARREGSAQREHRPDAVARRWRPRRRSRSGAGRS
jgi:hypothetical protein